MRFPAFLLTLALAVTALAQPAITTVVRPSGVTTLTLGADIANGIIAPAAGSRVRVPPLEQVTMLVPEGWSHPIQWTKDGKPIAGATGRSYALPIAITSDSGTYNITGAPFPFIATGISLEIVPAGHLGNFSARVELAAGNSVQIVGFSVGGATGKLLLVRAVGPTLKNFGLAKPVAQPRLRIFDSTGKEFGFVHPAVVLDLEAFFRSIGAFPLTGGENSLDYGLFPPGTYTAQITDQSGGGGTALIETYEFTTGPGLATPVTPIVPPGG